MRIVLISLVFIAQAAWASEKPTGEFAGYAGWWLRNARVEAFVIAEPYARVIAFRPIGGENPLHVSREYEYFGIRTWFLEPEQNALSPLPALEPASAETMAEGGLRLLAAPADSAGLQLCMEISLHKTEPILHIRHGMKNLRPAQRRIALWALNVIKPDGGVGVAPWRSENRQHFIFWPNTDPDQDGLHLGRRTLAVDYRVLPRHGWLKVGTDTDRGWVAYVYGERALRSSVAHVANGVYPEGGGTVTMFNSTSEIFDGKERFGEIENVGPLSDVQPDNWLWMDQELEIISGLQGDNPEEWIEMLDAR